MQDVTILNGSYRNQPLHDIRCTLVRPIKIGSRGWYGNFQIPGMGNIRVQLPDENSITYHGTVKSKNAEAVAAEDATDEQIATRIEDRFKILEEITAGVASDNVRSLIVSGAPGMGKSVGIQNVLDNNDDLEYNKVSGSIASAFQLYQLLFDNAEHHNVLILDDCDSLLFDGDCVNLLKAALESGDRPRIVNYNSESVVKLGMPKSFEFNGRVIFITNLDFQQIIDKDRGAAKHIAALVDRSLYLDLSMHTRREIWCRIETMVRKHKMLRSFGLDSELVELLLEYVKERRDDFRRLSLRTVVQLAQFAKTSPDGWRRMSEAFQMRPR